jgi:hypothetical protein
MRITATQKLWIKLFRSDRLEPHGSVFIIMFLNKLKVLSDKQFYDEKDKMMNAVYRWDVYDRINRSNKKDRQNSYGYKRAPKSIKPTKSR